MGPRKMFRKSHTITDVALVANDGASACRAVPMPLLRIDMFGIPVANASETESIDWLFARMACGNQTSVYYLNAHCSNVAAIDADYSEALSKADLILPDGSGVSISARLQGQRLSSTLSFTDFIPLVCQRLADTGGSVFLLGGSLRP